MARIDVSELLNDPDFVEQITLIKRTVSINEHGENPLTETASIIYACIQGMAGSELERQPQSARLHDTITIYTKSILQSEKESGYADVVVWQGNRYQVKSVVNFKNYGVGYTQGTCVLEAVNV